MDCEVLQQFERHFELALTDRAREALAVDAICHAARRASSLAPIIRKPIHQGVLLRHSQRLAQLRGWSEAGSALWTHQRANTPGRRSAEYQPPAMDEGIRDELADFVARRKREGSPYGLLTTAARPRQLAATAPGPRGIRR